MSKYDQIRKAAQDQREAKRESQGHVHHSEYSEIVNGIDFKLVTVVQGMNGHRAEQTLHYVDGRKVNQSFFKDALSQVSVSAAPYAGYDYRTPYGHFKINGNMIHAFSYEGAACGATTIASMKEVPVGDKANAIYAIVHRANSYQKLIERLNESQRLLDYRANQGDDAAGIEYAANIALLRELGESK